MFILTGIVFRINHLKRDRNYLHPSFCKVADNKDQYYIDLGNYRIIGIDREGKCEWTYVDTDASYKELAQAPDGRIFVTNYHYANEAAISSISIDEFSSSGKFMGSIYSVSYPIKHLFDKTSQNNGFAVF